MGRKTLANNDKRNQSPNRALAPPPKSTHCHPSSRSRGYGDLGSILRGANIAAIASLDALTDLVYFRMVGNKLGGMHGSSPQA